MKEDECLRVGCYEQIIYKQNGRVQIIDRMVVNNTQSEALAKMKHAKSDSAIASKMSVLHCMGECKARLSQEEEYTRVGGAYTRLLSGRRA